MTRALRWSNEPGSLLHPLDARRGSSCVFACGLRRRLVSGLTGHGLKFPVTLGQLVLLVSWRPGQSRLHPLSIPGSRPCQSVWHRIRWSPNYSCSKLVDFLPSLLRTHDLNVFLAILGQLVLLVLAARAEPSPSSQYTRVASSLICLTPYPLVPYL